MYEDEEFEDTASSSCASQETDDTESEGEDAAVNQQTDTQQAAGAAAEAGVAADSSITPFSFGTRPGTVADVSEFDTWDLVDSLLALAEC